MRLGLLVCVWKRHALAVLTMEHNLAAAKAAGLVPVPLAVLSPEDPQAVLVDGWTSISVPNSPLSDKWNAGMLTMKNLDVNAVMIIGSDDLVSEGVFRAAAHAFGMGEYRFGVLDHYILHAASHKARHWKGYPEGSRRHGESIGTCRTFGKLWLEHHDWKPWPGGLQSGLDAAVKVDAKGEKTVTMEESGAILDIKAYPLHDLGKFWEADGTEVPCNEVLARFPLLNQSNESHLNFFTVMDPVKTAEPVFTPWGEDAPLITACLLVKNEREMIGEALASLVGVADEVLVLDTGSTDGTPEIAEAYGAVVRREKAPPGPFDFGYWRNESLKGARGSWILIMDGDEWLASKAGLMESLSDVPDKVDAIAFQHEVLGQRAAEGHNPMVRLLRGEKVRAGKIYYEYANQHQLRGVESFQISSALMKEPWFDPVESALRSLPVLEDMLKRTAHPTLVSARNGKALGGRKNERNHALLYLSRAYAMLGSAEKDAGKRTAHYERAALHAGALVDDVPEQIGAWLVLIAVIEQVRGLIAVGPILDKALACHPKCRDLRWWKIRHEAALLSVLLSGNDEYPLVPQRWPLYWKLLPSIGSFCWMSFRVGEGKKPDA